MLSKTHLMHFVFSKSEEKILIELVKCVIYILSIRVIVKSYNDLDNNLEGIFDVFYLYLNGVIIETTNDIYNCNMIMKL